MLRNEHSLMKMSRQHSSEVKKGNLYIRNYQKNRACHYTTTQWVYPHSACRIQLNCEGSENGSEDDQRHGMAFTQRTTNEARTLHTAEEATEGEYDKKEVKSCMVWR